MGGWLGGWLGGWKRGNEKRKGGKGEKREEEIDGQKDRWINGRMHACREG